MPLCHQCPWNDRPPTEAKRAACLACPGPGEPSHKGRSHVSLDADTTEGNGTSTRRQTLAEVEASLQRMRDEAEADAEADALPLADCCRKTAIHLLDFLSSLNATEIKLLVEVAHGAGLAEIARAGVLPLYGTTGRVMTRANVSHIWRGIVKRFPQCERILKHGMGANVSAAARKRWAERKSRR